MTQTVYGILADKLGHASSEVLEQGADRPELRRRAWSTPGDAVVAVDEHLPIDLDHNGIEVGEVTYLERRDGSIWCVGQISDTVQAAVDVVVGDQVVSVDHDLYWSPTRVGDPDSHGLGITSVSLTASPARVNPQPVTILPGELSYRGAEQRWNLRAGGYELELLERAAAAHGYRRRHRGPLVISEHVDPRLYERATPAEIADVLEEQAMRRPVGPLRYSTPTKGSVLDVR
jgi:hypothetical protein